MRDTRLMARYKVVVATNAQHTNTKTEHVDCDHFDLLSAGDGSFFRCSTGTVTKLILPANAIIRVELDLGKETTQQMT
jgi:hypothetical protein